jgi:hypothetical protein
LKIASKCVGGTKCAVTGVTEKCSQEPLSKKSSVPDKVQIQVCSNHDPQGLDGAMIGKIIFTCIYIEKNLLQN